MNANENEVEELRTEVVKLKIESAGKLIISLLRTTASCKVQSSFISYTYKYFKFQLCRLSPKNVECVHRYDGQIENQ